MEAEELGHDLLGHAEPKEWRVWEEGFGSPMKVLEVVPLHLKRTRSQRAGVEGPGFESQMVSPALT